MPRCRPIARNRFSFAVRRAWPKRSEAAAGTCRACDRQHRERGQDPWHNLAATAQFTEQRANYLFATARRASLTRDFADARHEAGCRRESGRGRAQRLARFPHPTGAIRLALAEGISRWQSTVRALRKQTTQLGEIPVRLTWLQLELAAALRDGRKNEALTHYREALSLLKSSGRVSLMPC